MASIVSDNLGQDVRACWQIDRSNSHRSTVSLFTVTGTAGSKVQNVIVKQQKAREEEPYGPSVPQGPAWRLFNEWAALAFIQEECPPPRMSPELIGGNREHGFLVLEDLGEDAERSLHQRDSEAAENYLTELVRSASRLHAQTADRQQDYYALRQSFGPTQPDFLSVVATPDPHTDPGQRLRNWWPAICNTFGTKPHAESETNLDTVAHSIGNPGAFGSLTHGDFVPGNDLRSNSIRKLFDFEIADYRHALLDGAADPSIFHRGGRGEAIPMAVQTRLRNAYRQELVTGCREAADDHRFFAEVTRACIYRSLFQLHSILRSDLLTVNHNWGSTTEWHRILKALNAIIWTSSEYTHLEAIGETARRIQKKLIDLWPPEVHTTPYFPAFT